MVELYMARTCRYGKLRVIGGDLHMQNADVLITPANNRLSGREGLDALVHLAAGDDLRQKCRDISVVQRTKNLPPCPVTTCVTTEPYELKDQVKHIIHMVGPDCRRPNQDEARRELIREAYASLFVELKGIKKVKTIAAPPISMGVFAYPHREGARMTLEILLDWLENDDKAKIDEYTIIVKEKNFINNMRTVYRETEDTLPGRDTTNE